MALRLLSMKIDAVLRAGALVLGLATALPGAAGAPAPASPAAQSAAAPAKDDKKTPPPKPEEALLFTVQAGRGQVLGRSDADGRCKAFLGSPGQGWLSYADPKTRGYDYQAVSNPDGSQLALLSSRSGAINLWLVSADARDWQQLTDDDGGILSPELATGPVLAFSPDGKRLAVIRRGALWVLSVDGEQPRTLTFERGVRGLAWSPDSRWLAYLAGSSLRKVDASGAPDILVSSNVADQPDLAWHPDPKQELIFFLGRGLRKVDARRRVTLLAPSSSRPNDLAVLPSGKQVALLAPSENGRNEVFLATLSDKSVGLAQVTREGADGVLASAGGKVLYFLRHGVAWRCDLAGLKSKPLGEAGMGAVRVGQLLPLKGVCP